MKTILQWLVITFTATNCLGINRAIIIYTSTRCTGHDQCPDSKACIQGYCGNPCENLCVKNTLCTTFRHIPVCACKVGYTGNPFVSCTLRGEEHINEKPTVSQTPVISKTSPKGCKLPKDSPNVKFCSTAEDCEDCDYSNKRCHVSSGTEMAVETEVKVVCAPGYTVKNSDRAVCLSKGWFPPLPKCQMSAVSPTVSSPKRCKIPNDSPDIKYCSMGEGCSDCDYSNTKCHLAPGTEVDEGVQVKEVCASDTIAQISTATCYSKGWNPPFPKCQYRCGVSKGVNRSTPTSDESQPAHPGYFPWHAGIYLNEKSNGTIVWYYQCGGTLITNQIVLTVYYCVEFSDITNTRVALGKYHKAWEMEEPTAELRNVTEVSFSPHEFTYKSSIRYEIALLKLSEKVKFNEYIRPICIYFGDDTNELKHSKVYFPGLGRERQRPDKKTLDYKTFTLMPESECQKAIQEKNPKFQEVFCTPNPGLNRPGDAGGGLTAVDEDGLHYLIGYDIHRLYYNGGVNLFGITLFGKNRDWIESKANPNILD